MIYGMRLVCIILGLLTPIAGCGERNSAPQATPAQAPQQQADLPPPGEPDVGRTPPMPQPVRRSTLEGYRVTDFATGLQVPWDMAFAPEGRVYVTERPGRVRLIENGNLRAEPYATLANISARGEGGLMGIALHPNYPNPRWVYLMYSYQAEGSPYNRVSRFTDTGDGLTDERPVVVRIPGSNIHNGGIICFGPDKMLYIGTGDAAEAELAQDRSSLAGKILRVTPEGQPPADNPFADSPVYAYGFRNVQGLAWNPENNDLWATNHGPSGEFGLRSRDSVYIIQRGGNHGWPRVLGVTDRQGVVDPILHFPQQAVPPGLAVFYNADLIPELRGNFFFTSLRGEHLQRVILSDPTTISRIERWWETGVHSGQYGRLHAVVQGPDGALYVSTTNRDGRGRVRSGDDRILRVSPR